MGPHNRRSAGQVAWAIVKDRKTPSRFPEAVFAIPLQDFGQKCGLRGIAEKLISQNSQQHRSHKQIRNTPSRFQKAVFTIFLAESLPYWPGHLAAWPFGWLRLPSGSWPLASGCQCLAGGIAKPGIGGKVGIGWLIPSSHWPKHVGECKGMIGRGWDRTK